MLNFLKAAIDDAAAEARPKIVAIYAFLFALNIAVWAWAFIALSGRPALLGTAALAYVLGLRHAVDAGDRGHDRLRDGLRLTGQRREEPARFDIAA